MPPIFDLHAHPSFKPFNDKDPKGNIPDKDIWVKRTPEDDEKVTFVDGLVKAGVEIGSVFESQIHLDAVVEGQVGSLCLALYPLERGFIQRGKRQANSGPLGNDLMNFDKLLAYITGFDVSQIDKLQSNSISYFKQLKGEYQYLLDNRNITSQTQKQKGTNIPYSYQLVKNHAAIKDIIDNDRPIVPIVLSIEGGHAFAEDIFDEKGRFLDSVRAEKYPNRKRYRGKFEQYSKTLLDNILEVKKWEYPPFFVTLSHHFYNHLAGHSQTFTGIITFLGWMLNQTGSINALNEEGILEETSYFDLGIRDLGKEAIKRLLLRDGTHRSILIDIKHMSPKARFEYYDMLTNGIFKGAKIPIIFSHGAVNGRAMLSEFQKDEPVARTSTFNIADINLFDDEINTIIESDGIIGIMIDERRIVGKILPEDVPLTRKKHKKLKKEKRELEEKLEISPSDEKLKRELKKVNDSLKAVCISTIFNQIFHIIEIYDGINQEKAWDHICLGTDYEGLINPVDLYDTAEKFKTMEEDFINHWNERRKNTDTSNLQIQRYKDFVFDKEPKDFIRKFLWENAMEFLRKYFNDSYLIDGIIPTPTAPPIDPLIT